MADAFWNAAYIVVILGVIVTAFWKSTTPGI